MSVVLRMGILAMAAVFMMTSVASAQCCYYLPVPFLKQVPPGDWDHTRNCGQTCSLMLANYFLGSPSLSSSAITDLNKWISKYYNDKRYLDSNGWYLSDSKLKEVIYKRFGLHSHTGYGTSINDITAYGCSGYPVIVGVQVSGGKLVSKGGVAHWAIFVGFDGCNVILNDPGTSKGNAIRYSIDTFTKSWASQGKIFIPVYR